MGETKLSPSQLEFLENHLKRMEALELSTEAIEALERDFSRMNRGQELIELTQAIAGGLTGTTGCKGGSRGCCERCGRSN